MHSAERPARHKDRGLGGWPSGRVHRPLPGIHRARLGLPMPDRRPILMLIDGPSLVYRGYFALPPLTMSDGTLVNAVFGFLQIVLRGMQDLKPDFAMLSFDVGKPQFRF